jgi:hypothetical protein
MSAGNQIADARRLPEPAVNRAKRLDCVRLAGALASSPPARPGPDSGSKLRALQTLREFVRAGPAR